MMTIKIRENMKYVNSISNNIGWQWIERRKIIMDWATFLAVIGGMALAGAFAFMIAGVLR